MKVIEEELKFSVPYFELCFLGLMTTAPSSVSNLTSTSSPPLIVNAESSAILDGIETYRVLAFPCLKTFDLPMRRNGIKSIASLW